MAKENGTFTNSHNRGDIDNIVSSNNQTRSLARKIGRGPSAITAYHLL